MRGKNMILILVQIIFLAAFSIAARVDLPLTFSSAQLLRALAWYRGLAPLSLLYLFLMSIVTVLIFRQRQPALAVVLRVLILVWLVSISLQLLLGELPIPTTFDAKITLLLSFIEFAPGFIIALLTTGLLGGYVGRKDTTIVPLPSRKPFKTRKCPQCGATFESNPSICYACGTEIMNPK